mmetsp:Transcript_91566/g.191411  ORF Transcript_91566/g.191411 Transcript_91566/m.191411 type:complete len:330 (+) Transcript_91566:47-1036(+)|eukprot:CAMPEP_0206429396 /NCGR_PEP_ID=MMETSP0324_2-20121206/6216_1 /ASSEMBLY_ACC=CAM_ASM_000836 /TAXON_ID=2866 /ORGANISM="Crypthecodinium cohnii, Strain Seligo" /LENGTH=329 /DNA_ID=CAMNT_0053895069 /DNA_START=25 /DNA_END=1014 /DNA_ORIENTATION=+
MKSARLVPTAAEAKTWDQRIHKEELVNARLSPRFSLRQCVSALDIPVLFKVGHVDPSKAENSTEGFDVVKNGWDPNGADALEFRRCMKRQSKGPRDRQVFPVTSYQEHGWLLTQKGNPVERVKEKKVRLGFGWEWKAPQDYSVSTALPPPVLCVAEKGKGGSSSSSCPVLPPGPSPSSLSIAPPSSVSGPAATSHISSTCPPGKLAYGQSVTGEAEGDRATRVSAATTELMTRCSSSLPALHPPHEVHHPADVLYKRERKLDNAMQECLRYHKYGDRGAKHSHPLGVTDATKFEDDFTKATGMPTYKYMGMQESKLKDPKLGKNAAKWR